MIRLKSEIINYHAVIPHRTSALLLCHLFAFYQVYVMQVATYWMIIFFDNPTIVQYMLTNVIISHPNQYYMFSCFGNAFNSFSFYCMIKYCIQCLIISLAPGALDFILFFPSVLRIFFYFITSLLWSQDL